jgi:hypothetical protein
VSLGYEERCPHQQAADLVIAADRLDDEVHAFMHQRASAQLSRLPGVARTRATEPSPGGICTASIQHTTPPKVAARSVTNDLEEMILESARDFDHFAGVPSDHTQPATLAGTRSCSRRATSPIPNPPRGCLALDRSTPFLVPIEPPLASLLLRARHCLHAAEVRKLMPSAPFRVHNDYPIIPGPVRWCASAPRSPYGAVSSPRRPC